MNLFDNLARSAEKHPENIAVKLDDLEINYQFLHHATALAAGLLKSKGIEAGDRVGIMLPNVPDFHGA